MRPHCCIGDCKNVLAVLNVNRRGTYYSDKCTKHLKEARGAARAIAQP